MIPALSFPLLMVVFAIAAGVVIVCSLRATGLADVIADRTRLGEAIIGATLLGAATSLSGTVVSVTAASSGDASFAISNAIGGIAAQTLFLAIGDLVYRRANLEHAVAEPANLFQCVVLIGMLSLPLAAMTAPDVTLAGLHPVSVLLFLVYATSVRLAAQMRETPMWRPTQTYLTRHDTPEDAAEEHRSATGPLLIFGGLVCLMGAGGWVISLGGAELITRYGLASSLVGALVTAVATSLPELVTTLAAIRRGALQLAVGGIIGGNTFDVLFLVLSDMAYRDGSIYHAMTPADVFWIATGLLMTSVLLAGLILRQKKGPVGIGVESVLLFAIYAGAVALQVFATG
jgi:cation:H+ antiporter